MGKRRKVVAPWLDDSTEIWPTTFAEMFPTAQAFEEFKTQWAHLEKLPGVRLAKIPTILRSFACDARLERQVREGLDRLEFPEKATRIRSLVERLGKELDFDALSLSALAALHTTRAVDLATSPGDLYLQAARAGEAYRDLAASLGSYLDGMEDALRRTRGTREKPSIAIAVHRLRQAGLTQEVANSLIDLLKASDTSQATFSPRQRTGNTFSPKKTRVCRSPCTHF